MKNFYKIIFLIGIISGISFHSILAQDLSSFQQNADQGLIRVIQPGQLADTLNLWGDVRNSGKYLVPRGTNLTDLISYARGPIGLTNTQTWSKANLGIYISRYNYQLNKYQEKSFNIKLDDPLPQEMKNYPLHNGDVVTLNVKRKPSFRDYFTIIAPILSLGLTVFIAADRLNH